MSQEHVAMIDPHRRCIQSKNPFSPAGAKKKLSKFFKYRGHVSTFESMFELNTKAREYKGTIFRFPLRQSDSNSEISDKVYTPEMIQETLFESFKEESHYILLFLRNVKSISLMKWTECSPKACETYRVELSETTPSTASEIVTTQAAHPQHASSDIPKSRKGLETFLEVKTTAVNVIDCESRTDVPSKHTWLAIKAVGTSDTELVALGKKLMVLPWVGLATKLPVHVTLTRCEVKLRMPFDDCNTINTVFKQLEHHLYQARLSVKWSCDDATRTDGHAYCFLPLPECTAMPVHVHGYFAVTDNRRSIKWPAHDEKGEQAQWNKKLLYKMIAPSYALLLACRTCLICYKETPLPLTNTDNVTDAYSMWPLYPEVKNVPIWNELVSPTLSLSSSLPLLWTSADGGKWIRFSEAYFLSGSYVTTSCNCSPVVVQLVIKMNIPVVSLPKAVCETIKQNKQLMEIVTRQEISPHLIRKLAKENPQFCYSLSKKEVYDMLSYVLDDLDESNYFTLSRVPLLPLKRNSTVVAFEMNKLNCKYVFSRKWQPLIEALPGVDNLIVDPNVPDIVAEKLCEIANTGCLQLKAVSQQVICECLLPASIQSWCKERKGAGWRWTPGRHSMPSQSWIAALWKWIGKASVSLSIFQKLAIVPLLPSNDSHEEEVILIEPKKNSKLCCLSVPLAALRDKTTLTHILLKLGYLIVDKSRIHNCDVWINHHPDFKKFIPELSLGLEFIIQHLGKLDLTTRLQTVQKLDGGEKDFLRKQFSTLYESCEKYKKCLRSIPIYPAACSNTQSPCFIAIDEVGSNREAFLPPDNTSQLPDCPSRMLQLVTSPEEKSMYKMLLVKQLTMSELCNDYLIPLSLKYIQKYPNLWSVGDDLVLWVLKQQQLDNSVLKCISQCKIVCTRNCTHKKPEDTFDPHDHTLTVLFSIKLDRDHFPDERYLEDSHCRQALLMVGMRNWKTFQNNHIQMCSLLRDRMTSISTLEPSAQLSRGAFILQVLAEPANDELQKNPSLKSIPFLVAESCPSQYPGCLKEKWCGQEKKLYMIEQLYFPDDHVCDLVGTVRPILSHDYCLGGHAVSMRTIDKLAFQRITQQDVLMHLENLESVSAVSIGDVEKFNQIVMSAYEYLFINSYSQKLQTVWYKDAEVPGFFPAQCFVLEMPENLKAHLEPYYYFLKAPMHKYARLFHLHGTLTLTDVASVVKRMASDGKLTSKQVDHCVPLLNWLYDNQYEGSGMLMLTEGCTLVPATECVFDDRNWTKDSQSKVQLKISSMSLVHGKIPQNVAKYFQVKPLSHKVFPSCNVGFSYTKVGQYEDITHRLRQLVQDYETDIDIFKELIQNADDARATEINFLIDWRCHPTESLITKELKEWQGPALIVYNNATFSDEDFDNICKVAGETKKNDPFKTGRFGVGFCATYHLTDLPSFISRRYFTMFDSHTSYLGDRVFASAPGMRVDLIENNDGLQLYYDQFIPYDSLFGCNIFDLEADGYPGTLFRFPFRSLLTSQNSKICKAIYDRKMVATLVQALKKQSHELLLFLKHIKKVSLYELEEGCCPLAKQEVFSVECTAGSSARIELMKKGGNLKEHSCFTKFDIQMHNDTKDMRSTWVVSSAIGSCSSDIQQSHEAKGLLSLAEVAIKIDPSINQQVLMPIPDSKYGKVFCFLPLPITTSLPFHVNGFFSIGRDRRNISAADDETFGSLWNQSLAEGALVSAFINLLKSLCSKCDLTGVSDPEVKRKYLLSYYSLWKFSGAAGLISSSFTAAFKKCVPTLKNSIVWSEINGGCWLPPTSIVVFKDKILRRESKMIEEDVTKLLLIHGCKIADLPEHVYEVLKKSLNSSGRVYDYKKFCTKLLFPEIAKLDPKLRDRNIVFLLEQHGAHVGKDYWCKWAESFLSESPCIPCQCSIDLRPACQLISPKNKLLKNLYDVREGRFPSEELQKSPTAMKCLEMLGMTTSKLSIADLKDRAKSISQLTSDYVHALQRSQCICVYISSTYYYGSWYSSFVDITSPSNSNDDNPKELQELSTIPFLPVKHKPHNVDVPWCGKTQTFESPSQLYSSKYESLIFSQRPLVEDASNKAYECLGITSKEPPFELVIAHLKYIIEFVCKEPNDTTVKFLNKSMKELYTHIQTSHSSLQEVTQLERFIWQDGYFLSPSQVVGNLEHSCVPYLCKLTSANKPFKSLFGVQSEATLEMMVQVLHKITKDHGARPISNKILNFVEFTSKQVVKKMHCGQHTSFKIYLPDTDKVMHDALVLADNVSTEWMRNSKVYKDFVSSGTGHLVHQNIPHECVMKLGVKRLSHRLFPSQKVSISCTKVAQHEQITHRLHKLVQDYKKDIDVFKELIQNADDAEATEIKFLIDWRSHPTESLITKELKEWQGPALVAYNNATFSNEDFDNICKVGSNTKESNPFKTGRFGIGFCSTYHLTDVPSLISRRYFTMFDSHTLYLGDRVSAEAHCMRADLVENKDGLQMYYDQFVPYDGLFDCSIFDLKAEGYAGTLFRFPFRSLSTSQNSKICNAIYDRKRVATLVQTLKEQSHELLLFLKHVKKLSLYELAEGCNPSAAQEVFSVQCTMGNSARRIEFLRNCRSLSEKPCLTKFDIQVHDHTKDMQSTWIVSSAIGTCPSDKQFNHQAKGLLPLAEVAIKVDPSVEQQLWMPVFDSKYGKVFGFLPLPITTSLPFHVNGFISDRKVHGNISATDKKTFSSLWNQSLAKGALVSAFINLLESLCSKCDLMGVSDPEVKRKYLHSYYSLWNFSGAAGPIGSNFTAAFKKCVPTLKSSIVWSEINKGCWLPPTSIFVYKDEIVKHQSEMIDGDVTEILLEHDYRIADLPEFVYDMVKEYLNSKGRVYGYKKFCTELFFCKFAHIDPKRRDRNVSFLVEQYSAHVGNDDLYQWALTFLSESPCILCQCSNTLRPVCQLISPSNKLKSLFDVSEGRFPSKELQKSPTAMQGLERLGMATSKLSIANLEDRAKSISKLIPDYKCALQRSQLLCAYISSTYGDHRNRSLVDLKELQGLSTIPILPAKQKPHNVDVPWCGKSQTFYSPSQLYSSKYESLIFSQCPLVEDASNKAYEYLGITSKKPPIKLVIAHLNCVIKFVRERTNDITKNYLDKSMKELYTYIQARHSSLQEVTDLETFIWQDGFFLSPSQIVGNWDHNCVPYLCEITSANKQFLSLFGVQNEATLEMLIQVLHKIAEDHGSIPISKTILKFVEFTSQQLEKRLYSGQHRSLKIYLPDKDKIMRDTSVLFDDVHTEWMKNSNLYKDFVSEGTGHFVHKSIPNECAIKLGVKRLTHRLFTSCNVGISYIKVGQNDKITHRLHQLAQDYKSDVDVFNELIQNADDAGATEIKFLIDWRTHPTDSLITEELKEWQGPALIAYNNATLSDQDFDSICNIGGNTKKNDPMKTGRFGVGFCATYNLTDLPSFISRKYFMMFDSHASYLGDRISAEAPCMRVDLIENKDGLQLYYDQFTPYNGLFGCNVFDLKAEGYSGTLFRFPFRCLLASQKSKICATIYDRKRVVALVQSLKEQSHELLLFLKHIKKVSLYELKEGCNPSAALKRFSVQSTLISSARRIELIKNCSDLSDKSCLTKLHIQVHDHTKDMQSTWIVSSVIGACPSDKQRSSEANGLLPFAEVAIKVDPFTSQEVLMPISDSKYGKVFCFLPLPSTTSLPFHINGFFSIGKGHRNISATDKWNQSLAEGALVSAFINLLDSFCSESVLKGVSDPEVKRKYLHSYYSLWNFSGAADLIGSSFTAAFKKCAPTLKNSILWSEINGGCWLPPMSVVVFYDRILRCEAKIIEEDVIKVLLMHDYNIAYLPEDVYGILKETLYSSERVYDYRKFCTELLFPKFAKIDSKLRDRSMMFLLEQYGAHVGKDYWCKWAEQFLSESPCIPCQCSNNLRQVHQLIIPSNKLLKCLYDVSEGRFPCEELQRSPTAMRGLERLGMTTSKLSIDDLIDRAKSVAKLESDYEHALQRSQHICTYISSTYGGSRFKSIAGIFLQSDNLKELQGLSTIPFLPVKQKPCNVDVPWCGKTQTFESPSRLYSSKYESLIYSQCPLVEDASNKAYEYLGITSKKPPFDLVIAHLKCVIKFVRNGPNGTTVKFLNKSMKELYTHIQTCHSSLHEVMYLEMVENFIWQDGLFLSPSQVVGNWDHSCVPYLCKLTSANKPFLRLFGVQSEATLEMLVQVLHKITKDHGTCPISDKIFDFVVFTSEQLEKRMQYKQQRSLNLKIFLPDKDKIMRDTSVLADNVSTEWMKNSRSYKDFVSSGTGYLVHKNIPWKCAMNLGVNLLSHKVLPSHSTKVGQHEEITHKLQQLLQNYNTDIDIFKELIQNADDAEATEIKFLIDWRSHPTKSLITEELKEWQGPALIAYNNATFSDEDFDNICKLDGETKKNNPCKTGRFGIGFCSTYHLTDLPSFISRRYFAMFDSHTSYLGDRVSAEAPGMRVDLIENKDGIELYQDQFIPYDGLFDCNIFDLKAEGYPGTLFRFPFRSLLTSQKSKICKAIYDRKRVATLVQALKKQSHELILFLKHVKKVSLYELEEGCNPSAVQEVFSVQCTTGSSARRVELLKNGDCSSEKSCLTKFDIQVHDHSKDMQSTWIVSSAIGTCPLSVQHIPEAKSLLPFAEVAIKIDPFMDQRVLMPFPDSKYGKVFCFLPLPIMSSLPFHVNGFFNVGKGGRNILATGKKTFCSQWDQSLAEGALVSAFINLLDSLCSKSDLSGVDPEVKQKYLHSYYSLWDLSRASDLIGRSFTAAFNKCVPTLKKSILWSEINGGCWLPPISIVVFDETILKHETKVIEDVTKLLLMHDYKIANLPECVYGILKISLNSSSRVYDYKKFCTELLFPKFVEIDSKLRVRNMVFLVEQYGVHCGKDNLYVWAETFLRKYPCIPCQCSNNLRPVCQLISPSNKDLKSLYDVCEDRFPCEELQRSPTAMQCLEQLGMTASKLSIDDLIDRAKSVAKLKSDYEHALQRSQHICIYISSTYGGSRFKSFAGIFSQSDNLKELQALSTIPFLPVKQKPRNVDVPWCGKTQTFESPSQLYSSKYESLIFSQCPLVEDTPNKAYEYLGITSKKPPFDLVIAHLKCVIKFVCNEPNDTTVKFLDKSMKELYTHIQTSHSSLQEVTQLERFIWQDGYFLSPSQVVGNWDHNCMPYLCKITVANKQFSSLFGVQSEANLEMLVQVLHKIAEDNGTHPISDKVFEYVEFTSGELEKRLHCGQQRSIKIYLPDKDRIMRDTSVLVDNVSTEWMKNSQLYKNFVSSGTHHLVHKNIPHKRATKLGVKRLSHEIFPSHKVSILYTKVGQSEEITHRLHKLVQAYKSEIDIFKELIQNADDAGATEIKFLIDWRTHPTESLITEGLKEWQGPALIAYNNATFSDEDFDNICKIAGETKKNNPFKTGRFGVGFCSTYHLTDLPSFISRRYFTMFDSHTTYLGDRVSADAPCMRVDLIKNKDGLQLYRDQFIPYNELFECNIFDLKSSGLQGTLFRFPFRSLSTSQNSKICKTIYDRERVATLVQALKQQSYELILFLKCIKKVSLYELEEGCNPSAAQEVFSVQCTVGSSAKRVELIKNCDGPGDKSCLTRFNIEVHDHTKDMRSTSTWVVSSAIGTRPSDKQYSYQAKGLLPLAEVAIKVDQSMDERLLMPVPDSRYGMFFCCLPLAFTTSLPFHVNGLFDIEFGNRYISAADDKTFGSLWKKLLAGGAPVSAFINLLDSLCSKSGLAGVSDPEVKRKYLDSYYSLWNFSGAADPISSSFTAAFKKCVPTLKNSIIWSEINGGCWLPPTSIVVFKDKILRRESKTLEGDIIELLLKHGYRIADLPECVYQTLKKSLYSNSRVCDYRKFCSELLFPKFADIDPNLRDRNILYLVEQYGAHLGKDNWYQWAETLLSESPCIPCQCSNTPRPVYQLISPSNKLFKSLFDVSEGRFPSEELQRSPTAMRGLESLGMATAKLRIADLKDIAKSITQLKHEYEHALQRSQHVCAYISSLVGTVSQSDNLNELQELSTIPFLPVKQKPHDVDLPWCGKTQTFESPSQLYSSKYESLIFSQCPLVEDASNKAYEYLGITSKKPPFELVIAHLKCIIEFVSKKTNDATKNYLDKSMKELYSYIQASHSSLQEVVHLETFIWQDGFFLSPSQVVCNWDHDCVPYLCKLTSANKQFSNLFGVKSEATLEMLVEVLLKITKDHGTSPISDKILEFIEFISGQIEKKINYRSFKIYLPDKDKIMRDTSVLAGNARTEWMRSSKLYKEFVSSETGYLVHKNISWECAIKLGVIPLLEAVIDEVEDHEFLKGTEFGQYEGHYLCKRLNGFLKVYPADVSIIKELIQSADDAQATEITFVFDHRTNFSDSTLVNCGSMWKSLQHTPALCIFINRKITDADIERITNIGEKSKDGGRCGVGFNAAYHVTDCPSFVSYAESGVPECLCVFDPTLSFVPHATKQLSARKWNFTDKYQYSEFSDQFQPYLHEDLYQLSQHAPGCLVDYKKYGFVVFRLPLTRCSNELYTEKGPSKLTAGHTFNPSGMSKLIKEFTSISQDALLFLNHLRSVSAFEIQRDGSFKHHFTTSASVSSPYLEDYENFSKLLRCCTKTVSLAHIVDITHTQSTGSHSSQWLVQRVSGGTKLKKELLEAGLHRGLLPVGGVATPLKSLPNHTFNLYCSLPLPISSNLPVHINGHFLVDKSRKHLESNACEGLEDWNKSLAEEVIVPAYVDLIMTVHFKCLVDPADTRSRSWFYSLFPRQNLSASIKIEKEKVDEVSTLNIIQLFYRELLQQNPAILIREEPSPSLTCHWMNVRSCLFCVPFTNDKTESMLCIDNELRSTLVSLGLQVTNAPNYIYHECTHVDSSFTALARIEPEKVVKHLQTMKLTVANKEIIKKNIQCLLHYCTSGYKSQEIASLFSDTLYLVAKDGSLQRRSLFQSHFSDLLPHRADKFIDPKLESSKVGERLQSCGVICSLPLEYVLDNVDLPDESISCNLSDINLSTLKLLWEFLIDYSQANRSECLSSLLIKHFSTKAVIPTRDDKVYPICFSKILVRESSELSSICDNCRVMKKLGYPQIDYKKIGISDRSHLSVIINKFTSCFVKGEDIVNCFKLCGPQNCNIQLSDSEATSFSTSLGSTSSNQLQEVSSHILNMPLFHAVDGSRISLHGMTKAFILTSTTVPHDGLPTSHDGQVILKDATSEERKNLYEGVLPRKLHAYIGPEEFYLQLILPSLPNFEVDVIKKHIKYLFLHRETMCTAFAELKKTPFIRHNEQFFKVCDLCDHTVEFFNTFKQEYVLPALWRDRIDIMKCLDLQTNVIPSEWLLYAQKFSSDDSVEMAEYISRVLLNELIKITQSNNSKDFLQKVANIEFLYYSPESCELNVILFDMFPEEKLYSYKKVKFSGSVLIDEANIACLCKAVLPESCQPLISQSFFREALYIEDPVSPKTVVENLKRLGKRVSMNCTRSLQFNQEHVTKLIHIFETHYAHLSKEKPPHNILCELEDVMCILLTKSPLLQLVKPSQLVMQLPPDCSLEPYCYRVAPWLQKYGEFLLAVGVRQDLTAKEYINILTTIHKELQHDNDVCADDKKVIETAYTKLVYHLRRETEGAATVTYLPDESMKLTKSSELCLNDAPWYRSRLPPDCGFKIILQPPVDDKGHRTLPKVLKIKRLSEIITERLQESCKSPSFVCTDEELFTLGRRPESGRCVFVRSILETLNSDEFFHGFCRMHYTEYKCPPTESFKLLVQKLKQVQICCVITDIKTVLCLNDQPIPATEDCSKFCHLSSDSKTTVLYIAPHSRALEDGDLSPFFKDLAVCISKLINNEIKNMVPIAAIFGCHPSDIPKILTREQISEMLRKIPQVLK